MEVEAVLWDFDGTLVDTAELHFQAWVEVCRLHGRAFTRQDFAATFGRRNPEIMQYLFPNIADAGTRDAIAIEKEHLYCEAAVRHGVEMLPGAKDCMEYFFSRGIPQAIASSAPRRNLDLLLEACGAAPFIQAIVAMEDVREGKPNPEVFLRGGQKLGAEPAQTLVFEDAVAGVEAAKAAGMKCIAVTFVGHHSEEKLRAAGADLCVPSLAEVSEEMIAAL